MYMYTIELQDPEFDPYAHDTEICCVMKRLTYYVPYRLHIVHIIRACSE